MGYGPQYDIPAGDIMDKVDAFLHDVELQKQKDAEKFEAMRSGAIDEIFMEEFREILSNKNSDSHQDINASDVAEKREDPAKCEEGDNIDCQKKSTPAPPPLLLLPHRQSCVPKQTFQPLLQHLAMY